MSDHAEELNSYKENHVELESQIESLQTKRTAKKEKIRELREYTQSEVTKREILESKMREEIESKDK